MKRDLVVLAVFWLALSLLGEALAGFDVLPLARADKGEDIRHAWGVLMRLGVPVFALVVAVLLYSLVRFRHRGAPDQDGMPLLGTGVVPKVWFGVTSALAALVIIYPGISGTHKVMEIDPDPDVIVSIQATRWAWIVRYPQHEIMTMQELVLPVDQAIRFDMTSVDVIHSAWVPAFLLKLDAVPGMTTHLTFRTTATGAFETDVTMRLQCAELCGKDHALMDLPVRVVTREEYGAWIAAQPKQKLTDVAPTPAPAAQHSRH